MQTLTTVGYGDIAVVTTDERLMCLILQFIGIIFFSFSAGSITNIISNSDQTVVQSQERLETLNRLQREYEIPPDLYIQILTQIKFNNKKKEMEQTRNLVNQLPYNLQIKTNLYLYRDQYQKCTYLNELEGDFLAWICPLLEHTYIPIDQYIYYEADLVEEIFFLTDGNCGFVIPLKDNIVYIEIEEGDTFGQLDIVLTAIQNQVDIHDVI